MNWKLFLPLPLAALVLGTPLYAPKLRPPLPNLAHKNCEYARAVKFYLFAYAYAPTQAATARAWLSAAESARLPCGPDSSALADRIRNLARILSP